MSHVFIAGCGYVGIRLARRLHAGGHQVSGLRRSTPPPEPGNPIHWITGDIARPDSFRLPGDVDVFVLAAGLKRDTGDQYDRLFGHGYTGLVTSIKASRKSPRIIMVSTTGVFSELNGGWVDEKSPVHPDASISGKFYLRAEATVRNAGLPYVIARLSGIYGPERIRLIREVSEGRAVLYPPPPHYLNHLHAEDAAGALAHLIQLDQPASDYIVSDSEPADRNDVLCWLAARCGMPTPSLAGEGTIRPARRSGNKRCANRRLIESGYQFMYPTFREGYESLLRT